MRTGFRPSWPTLLGSAAVVLAACGGEAPPEPLCTPGASVACTCADGRSGAQTCNAEGTGLGLCRCAEPDAGPMSPDAGPAPIDAPTFPDVPARPDAGPPPVDAPSRVDAPPAIDAYVPPPEIGELLCSNGLDDDFDGLRDCADAGCASATVCTTPEATESLCSNGLDDDRDALTDCDDPGCLSTVACAPPPETSLVLCSNGLDDDRDGSIDCLDRDCWAVASCDPRCAAVPLTGRCASDTQVEFCAITSGTGTVDLSTYDCAVGESCVVSDAGAECVLTAFCRDGDVRCIDATRVQVCEAGAWTTLTCPRSCVGTALGDGCSPDTSVRTTTGVVRYDARGPNAGYTDWGSPFAAEAKGFVVASARIDPTTGSVSLFDGAVSTLGDATTGGRFSLSVPSVPTSNDYLFVAAVGVDGTGRITHAVANPGYSASTTPRRPFDPMPNPQVWVWAWPLSGRVDGSELRITEAMGSGAARVFDYLRYTQGLTSDYFLPPTPRTVVAWVGLDTTWDCGACAARSPATIGGTRFQQQVWIRGGAARGYWSDAVTAHEFGHVAMNAYGVSPGEAGPHNLGIPVQPGMGWSEGWATFFSADVRNSERYYDKQTGFFWFDIQARSYSSGVAWTRPTPSGGLFQAIDENEVSAMLWTLSAYVPRSELWEALRAPRVTAGPFERGYTRRVWSDPTRPFLYTDTGVNVPCFADYLDALLCLGAVDPATVDAATQPTTRYPYPSRSPLCR
jgi:hypothetical protein